MRMIRNGGIIVARRTRTSTRGLLSQQQQQQQPSTTPLLSLRFLTAAAAPNGKSSKALMASKPPPKQTWRTKKKRAGAAAAATASGGGDDVDVDASHSATSWVPPAYRGLGAEVRKHRPGRFSDHRSGRSFNNRGGTHRAGGRSADRDHRPGRRHHEREHLSSPSSTSHHHGKPTAEVLDSEDAERAMHAQRVKEESLFILFQDLMRLAPQYRNHFQKDSFTLICDDDSRVLPSSNVLQKRIHDVLKGIHVSDVPVEWKQVEGSAWDFQSVCRALLHMCSISCSLTSSIKYNDKDASKYVDLAEFVLLQLVQLGRDRSLFVNSVKHWITTGIPNESAKNAGAAAVAVVDDESPRTVTGWFSRLVGGFVPSLAAAPVVIQQEARTTTITVDESCDTVNEEEASASSSSSSAITGLDDPTLQQTKRLFRTVLGNIAATARLQPNNVAEYVADDGDVAEVVKTSVDDRAAYEVASRRMLDLLDRMPSSWPPDTEAFRYVMEILGRAGTLESARMCKNVYHRYSSGKYRLNFALVLEAYLEAVMRETDKRKTMDLVGEVLDILNWQWNVWLPNQRVSSHRLERIVHGSIALHCMAVAEMGKVPGMCERGEQIMKRALGGTLYTQFRQEVLADNPKVDTQTLPLANFLAQLFASSGDSGRVDLAKKILKYMMQHDSDRVSRFAVFPNVNACNAVLFALLERYEGKLVTEIYDVETAQADFDFARDVLDYMNGRSEMGCWPNADTHGLMFRFLDAVSPADIGNIAEDLISMIEMRQFLSRSSDDTLSLSTYHRVMRYWLQEAKTPPASVKESRGVACERAVRLLKKLEVQSIPMTLSDSALGYTSVKNLYDVSLRPVRLTYKMALQICVDTFEPDDQEKAAAIAIEVYKMMIKRRFDVDDDTESLLTICSSRLAPESENRRNIEELLNLSMIQHEAIRLA